MDRFSSRENGSAQANTWDTGRNYQKWRLLLRAIQSNVSLHIREQYLN